MCEAKGADEDWVGWLSRTKKAAHEVRQSLGIASVWHTALASVHGWAGHLHRKGAGHPGHDVVKWRGAAWWIFTQVAAHAGMLANWRHPQTNWPRGFEAALAERYGPDWSALTLREAWKSWTRTFVCFGVRKWGGPRGQQCQINPGFARAHQMWVDI